MDTQRSEINQKKDGGCSNQQWPQATLRMEAKDSGIILRHGDGPGRCDVNGARNPWVFEHNGLYYMHYDAASDTEWPACLAVSKDLVNWDIKGPYLELGSDGEDDSKWAGYGVTYFEEGLWHMFYIGCLNDMESQFPPPKRWPVLPYLTLKAKSKLPSGPWIKQKDVVPFRPKAGTYYSLTASSGQVVKYQGEYLQFFSCSVDDHGTIKRTISIARTKNLDSGWTVDPEPIVPLEEQIENSSLYYEPASGCWFLFTNHVGIIPGVLPDDIWNYWHTDAVWVYWTKDLNKWNAKDKAVVLDRHNCTWSQLVGLPSVIRFGNRLALFYDGYANGLSHVRRDIGLAWLDLPLVVPHE